MADAFRMLVSANVRRFRRGAGLTQEDLAHGAELDRTYVSDIERGRRNVSLGTLENLAAVLQVHPALFLVDEDQVEAVRRALLRV